MKKVKTKWVINLPTGAVLKVKSGDVVQNDQVLAEVTLPEEKIVNLNINLEKYKDKLIGKSFNKGEVLIEIGGFFKKKIICPTEGLIEKIDEYNNIYFKLPEEIVKKIISPVESEVGEIKNDSLTLEFKAIEFTGEGVEMGRVWGKNGIKVVEKVVDLSITDGGKIMAVSELNPTLLAKAEVIGITGVIVINDDKIKSRLPILKVSDEEYKNILAEADNVKRAMLNANTGRLLLVI